MEGVDKSAAVIILFHHFLHGLQSKSVLIGKVRCEQYFKRRIVTADKTIFLLVIKQPGSFEDFQKSQLKLLWLQRVNIVEGAVERLIIFVWQPRDEIQVLMDIVERLDFPHGGAEERPVILPADGAERLRVRRLNADFKLELPGPDRAEKIQCFPVQ